MIDLAIKKLAKLKSVAADLVQDINMLNQKFTIKGSYRKGTELACLPPAHRRRGFPIPKPRPFRSATARRSGITRLSSTSPVYRKLSIKPILERLNSPDLDPKMRDQAITQMGLAGPETLLVGLTQERMKFDLKEEGELDGKKVWKLRGTWRTRQGLVGPDGRPVDRRRLLAALHPDGRHALPGQGRRLALQARSSWAGSRRLCSRRAAWDRTAGPSAQRARSRRSTPARSR